MRDEFRYDRRQFLRTGAGLATAGLAAGTTTAAFEDRQHPRAMSTSIKQVTAGVLDVGYWDMGPDSGPTVLLLHGFPYSINSYETVAPILEERGCRVIVPYLRGHGSTRFLDHRTPRSGQQGAIGVDVVALMDALQISRAVVAGYDWGGRAACVVAALWPERCVGLVSVNSYLIQDIANARLPLPPSIEAGLWYQYYFQTERGRAGLIANRREIARTLWHRNSPNWRFSDAMLDRHAAAFENADYIDVVIHSYRHRLGLSDGYPAYTDVERRLARLPAIRVPTITLDGSDDGVVPANDGRASSAKFTGPRSHRVVQRAGHNLPEEAPREFANAVWELARA